MSTCHFIGKLAVLLLAGTANGLFGQMLYVGNANEGTISSYVIDQESGLLTEIFPRVAALGTPTSVAVHPSGKFAYVSNGGSPAGGPNLAAFSIDPGTGALTRLGSSALTLGSNPQAVAVDPSGKFAFVAHQGANNVSAFSIDPSTGATSAVPGSPFATPNGPSCVVVHPNGKFAYVSAAAAGQIGAYSIGASGALTAIGGSPFAARNNLIWMAMDPAGKFLFAVERQDNAVLVYSVNATTGALTQVGTPFNAGALVSGVAVDPAGKFLYVSNFSTGGVTVLNIGATGALSQSRGFGAIIGAYAVILDPSGKFLYVPGQSANALAGLAIDSATGALSPLPQPFFNAGVAPQRGATVLLSPPVIPPIGADSVLNYHSRAPRGMPNAGIAQGSRMAISGTNIGPAVGVSSDNPLSTELGGASIQIQSGDVTIAALMVFASNNLVTAVVPSNTPLGDATATLTYKGRTTAALPFTVVPISVGIRTRNEKGVGPARVYNVPPDTPLRLDESVLQNPNTLNRSAKPGQTMVVQATGLGPTTGDETQSLLLELDVPVDVIVGNKPADVLVKVRGGSGADFIAFKLPDDAPEGCYVPLAIRAGGVTSNVASLSISSADGSCSDPYGLSAADIDAAQKAGQLTIATLALSHLDIASVGVENGAGAVFARYDFNSLLSAYAIAGDGQALRSSFATPPAGTCTVVGTVTKPGNPYDIPSDPAPFQPLNAGSALNLKGPAGTVQLPAPNYTFNPDGEVIKPGEYAFDNGAGNAVIGPFKAVLTMPPPITWTNKDDLLSPDRSQDLTITWTGGAAGKEIAAIVGISSNGQATGGFLCTEKVSAGQFTVPAWVLSAIPASAPFTDDDFPTPGGALAVGVAPVTSVGRFTGLGLDVGVFTYEQAAINFVSFR